MIERNLGQWEGMSPADLQPSFPGYHFPESAYSEGFDIPGAEPLQNLTYRIQQALTAIHHRHKNETVAISTHSGVIWTILHKLVTNPPETFFLAGEIVQLLL